MVNFKMEKSEKHYVKPGDRVKPGDDHGTLPLWSSNQKTYNPSPITVIKLSDKSKLEDI